MSDIGDISDVKDVADVRVMAPASSTAMYGFLALALIFGGILYFRVRR